jgi:hypothetical protein
MSEMEVLVWGLLGSALDEILHWSSFRRRTGLPTYLRETKYWIVTALLIAGGGITALAVGTSSEWITTPLAALLAGFTAPALLKKLAKAFVRSTTAGGKGTALPDPSIRHFLTH